MRRLFVAMMMLAPGMAHAGDTSSNSPPDACALPKPEFRNSDASVDAGHHYVACVVVNGTGHVSPYWYHSGKAGKALFRQNAGAFGVVPWLHPAWPVLVRVVNGSTHVLEVSVTGPSGLSRTGDIVDGDTDGADELVRSAPSLFSVPPPESEDASEAPITPHTQDLWLTTRPVGPWTIHVQGKASKGSSPSAPPVASNVTIYNGDVRPRAEREDTDEERPGQERTSGLTPPVQYTMEAVTVPAYSGALRLGLGISYVPSERSYGERRLGDQSMLVESSDPVVNPELVVGYSYFASRTGRSYVPNASLTGRARWGFYAGVGVLSLNTGGFGLPVRVFQSVHLGGDYEFGRNLSLAIVGTVRGVQRPLPGYDDGSVIQAGESPFKRTAGLGLGVVLNLTPSFGRSVASVTTSLAGKAK